MSQLENIAMREFGTLSCWRGSKGSSVSPVHLTQERCLMPCPVSHPEIAQPFSLVSEPGAKHTEQEGEVRALPHHSSAHLMPTAKVLSRKGWTHPLHTARNLWPLSSFTQLTASQDTQTVPEQGCRDCQCLPKPLTPSPVTNSQCRQVSKSHRLSSEQPSSLDPYSTSQLWKPKLPALQGWRTGNSCCWNEGC